MTINIMIHCRDGIVFGCDSFGSMIQSVILPKTGSDLIDPNTGQAMKHPRTGKLLKDLDTMTQIKVVTNTFGFENKLFRVSDYPMGVVTSGMATLGKRTVGDLMYDFSTSQKPLESFGDKFSVEPIVKSLKDFFEEKYRNAFKTPPGKPPSGPILNFLVGGYSPGEIHGETYEISFPQSKYKRLNSKEKPFGMITGGQSDAVERFLQGVTQDALNKTYAIILSQMAKHTGKILQAVMQQVRSVLKEKKIAIPKELQKLPIPPTVEMELKVPHPVRAYKIPLNLMSIEDTIEFIVFLAYITYGRQRFVIGVPTVGGKFHIATATRREGYNLLEPREIGIGMFR